MTPTVATVFTTLGSLGIGAVLAIGLMGAAENTQTFIRERSAFALSTTKLQLDLYLDPVSQQTDGIVAAVGAGRLDLDDDTALRNFLDGALKSTPQLSMITLVRPDLRVQRFTRDELSAAAIEAPVNETILRRALDWGRQGAKPRWALYWAPALGEAVMLRQTALNGPRGFAGILVSAIALDEFSQQVARISRDLRQTVFLLFDKEFVVAHPQPPPAGVAPSAEQPLLTLAQFGDPILARIWDAEPEPLGEADANVETRRLATPQDDYHFIYRVIDRGDGHSFVFGTYYRGSLAKGEIARLRNMAVAGFGVLLLSVALTVVIGHRLGRPIVALAAAAGEIEKQHFDNFRPLAHSHIREIDQAGQAFNQMVEGLRERQRIRDLFGKYVPNEVVEQLIADPEAFALGGARREISLLFTDIAGFTTLSEKLPPETVLDLLNAYFEGVTRCITEQGGIIVDFIGDAVFAIFGAPVAHADHARRAIACAHEVDQFARAFAAKQQAQGIPLGGTRIGLHTGMATVGNMGSSDRLKYSAAGDVVNTASRLEGANKLFDTRVMAGSQTIRDAGETLCRPVGRLVLKGRAADLEVFEILSEAEAAGGWLESYRHAYETVERNPVEAKAEFDALAGSRPDDKVIRFHLNRLDRGIGSVVIELTEK